MNSSLSPFHARPQHSHHDFVDEFAYLVLGVDPGLAGTSAGVTPLDTITNRQPTLVEGDSESGNTERASMMRWSCSGCRRARSETGLTALQLDVFQSCGRCIKAHDANPGRQLGCLQKNGMQPQERRHKEAAPWEPKLGREVSVRRQSESSARCTIFEHLSGTY